MNDLKQQDLTARGKTAQTFGEQRDRLEKQIIGL